MDPPRQLQLLGQHPLGPSLLELLIQLRGGDLGVKPSPLDGSGQQVIRMQVGHGRHLPSCCASTTP
ncbi:hypothetical protein [Intrasporangium calvum]|uniref:hypothetical protein n=1 Tax=Intrasporangium calvum TaxID=53358 RepID=UPI001F34C45B|nr:hypothetical protein [Intrasporangium calvum]